MNTLAIRAPASCIRFYFNCLLLAVLAGSLGGCGGGSGGAGAGGPAAVADPVPPGETPPVPQVVQPVPDTLAPQASFLTPPPALSKDQALVIGFSEPMDAASLALSGDLAPFASASWNASANTLTLSPGSGGWPRGPGHGITVAARDRAGNALTPLQGDFLVRLAFTSNQPAAAVIGQVDFNGVYGNQPYPPGVPSASNLGGAIGNPLLSPQGRLVVADTGNNRLMVYAGIPAASGAAAVAVVGQPDFSSKDYVFDAAHRLSPRGMAAWQGRFIVSEHRANRVVIYSDSPLGATPTLPTVVLGVPDFTTNTDLGINAPTCDATHLSLPTGVAVTPDGRLLVADSGHHRVLVWNTVPTASGTAPDLVLGQPDMTTCAPGTVSARSLNSPVGLWTDGTRLVVVDAGNHRALVWNGFPQASFASADLVLGQPDFTSSANAASPSATTVARQLGGSGNLYGEVASNGVQLAIADSADSRVLIWDDFPARNGQPADVVLGQAGFSERVIQSAGATSVYFPTGILFTQDALVVPNGYRVSVFKSQ